LKDALESYKHNSNHFGHERARDAPLPCTHTLTTARNPSSPQVATIALERDETSRQFSQFHRFEPTGALFDCSLPRHPFDFR
jgi:hypothetical protein